jgi:2-polyprenyl-3-methyl-5-hydroxy-6-metoxy-1,4-benzoquinol methylase
MHDYESNEIKKDEYSCFIRDYTKHKNGHDFKFKKILKEIEELSSNKGKLLEIGCAAGFFLDYAQKMGWQVMGIEPEESMAKYAIEKFGLSVEISTIESVQLPENHFDLIIALNVLSHLQDPKGFFKKIYSMLKSDGLFVFQTGNKGDITSKEKGEILGESWLTPEHLYHFSEYSLNMLLSETGFRVKHLIKEHVIDHLLSEETLRLNRSSNAKWLLKKMLLKYVKIRHQLTLWSKFYYSKILNADVCSLLYFTEKI